ncbi:protein RRNAD1-like [Homarus americanus]|uniref:protein RRNAD1-like n=1 Tax=Homarus americanus TaxID=6706 RepID=UPI001C44D09F|nr:protein RRNAD1-like [Homarus americanus]
MDNYVHLNQKNVGAWKDFTKSAVMFLDLYRNLLDTYVLDFFTEDLWSRLNPEWATVLDTLTPCELADFLSRDGALKQKTVWPLSLVALRATAFTYTLPRRSVSSTDPFTDYLNQQLQKTERLSGSSDNNEMKCDVKSTLNENVNWKIDVRMKSPPVEMDLPSIVHTDVDLNAAVKYTKTLSTRQSINNDSVAVMKEECSDSCGSQHCIVYKESPEIQKTEKNKNINEGEDERVSSPLSVCQPHKACRSDQSTTDSRKLIHPIQQMSVSWGDAASELSAAAGQHKLLQHVFRRHLKPKKQHEVARLALIAGQVAQAACDGVMIDVGSGQGHLSRLLAYGHDVRVVCLEAQDEFVNGAKKFDNQLEMAVEKMKRRETSLPPLPPAPRHTACLLHPHINPHTFKQVVTGAWPELESRGAVCGLLGLHTCGNLAPTLLRIFTNMSTCQAVVSVACCYMKLNTARDEREYPGYPMSDFVYSLPGFVLTYEAREVACHAIEMYVNRLRLGVDNLKVHCYRASLEEIIIRHWPSHHHAGLRSVNHAHKMEFSQYAVEAVSRLPDFKLPQEDLCSNQTKHNLSRWMQVVVYYSLRLLLAPVVESLVLLDRLLFLYEQGVESILVPTFDPQKSPRNHVLVAVKPNNKL